MSSCNSGANAQLRCWTGKRSISRTPKVVLLLAATTTRQWTQISSSVGFLEHGGDHWRTVGCPEVDLHAFAGPSPRRRCLPNSQAPDGEGASSRGCLVWQWASPGRLRDLPGHGRKLLRRHVRQTRRALDLKEILLRAKPENRHPSDSICVSALNCADCSLDTMGGNATCVYLNPLAQGNETPLLQTPKA